MNRHSERETARQRRERKVAHRQRIERQYLASIQNLGLLLTIEDHHRKWTLKVPESKISLVWKPHKLRLEILGATNVEDALSLLCELAQRIQKRETIDER